MTRLPEQFSKEVYTVLKDISLSKNFQLVGSSADHQIMYYADYDLFEKLPLKVKLFQRKIAMLNRKYIITDIKCGEISEWNLLTTKKYSQSKELAHLKDLFQKDIITPAEFAIGEELLKPRLTVAEKVRAKKKLKFGVLRWTPEEVANGYKVTRRNLRITLVDAMKTTGITKIDILVWLNNTYVEVSNILLWTKRNGSSYAKLSHPLESLREDIARLLHEGNYFKALKRLYSLTEDPSLISKIQTILNSPLGHIYVVVSDLKALDEFGSLVNSKRKRKELNELRNDMAKLYFSEFDHAKNPELLLPRLENVLQEQTKKAMMNAKLLPLPKLYRVEKI